MSEKIVQPNEEVIKSELKELMRGSVDLRLEIHEEHIFEIAQALRDLLQSFFQNYLIRIF